MENKSIICQILDGFRNIRILSVSETHLSPESEAEVQIEGYSFIAKSRASGHGGGVGVYISSSISFQRRMDLDQEDIEYIWIEIIFPKTKGFLDGIIYRLPDSSKHLCTISIDLFTDTAAILISIVSNSYYGMPRGQIHINLPPEHPIMSFETIEIKITAVSAKRSFANLNQCFR